MICLRKNFHIWNCSIDSYSVKDRITNLEITKDVKPKAKDNDDEEELRQRGEGGRSQKAIKDEARTLPVRGHAVTERPQQVHEYFDPFDIEREEYDFYP